MSENTAELAKTKKTTETISSFEAISDTNLRSFIINQLLLQTELSQAMVCNALGIYICKNSGESTWDTNNNKITITDYGNLTELQKEVITAIEELFCI
jgi:hypothetical protein